MPQQAREELPILCVNVVFRGGTLFSSAVGSTSVVLVLLTFIRSCTCHILERSAIGPRTLRIVGGASCTLRRRAAPVGRQIMYASGVVRVECVLGHVVCMILFRVVFLFFLVVLVLRMVLLAVSWRLTIWLGVLPCEGRPNDVDVIVAESLFTLVNGL